MREGLRGEVTCSLVILNGVKNLKSDQPALLTRRFHASTLFRFLTSCGLTRQGVQFDPVY
jgi:hypothetical protein